MESDKIKEFLSTDRPRGAIRTLFIDGIGRDEQDKTNILVGKFHDKINLKNKNAKEIIEHRSINN